MGALLFSAACENWVNWSMTVSCGRWRLRCQWGRLLGFRCGVRGLVAFYSINLFTRKEPVALFVQILTGFFVHQVKMLFVDEHGLNVLPFEPGLLGDVIEDLLTFGAWEGLCIQAGQVFF